MSRSRTLVLLLATFAWTLLAAPLAHAAPSARPSAALTPERRRITDEDFARDLATFARWQQVLDSLSNVEPRPSVYQLATAQGLLNFARQQYERGDRCGAVATAFDEGVQRIERMRAGDRDPLAGPPTILGAAAVRPDLWQQARELRGHAGARCIEAQVAQSESKLLQAAHEAFERQPCDSTRLVTEAQALLDEARATAEACVRQATSPTNPGFNPQAPERRAVLLREIEQLPKYVRFELDSANVDAATALILDLVADKLARYSEIRVRLSGHTVSRSSLAYNLLLSKQRTENVRIHLVRAGIRDDRMDVEYYASPMPRALEERVDAVARDHCVVLEYMVPGLDIFPAPRDEVPEPPVDVKPAKKAPRKSR